MLCCCSAAQQLQRASRKQEACNVLKCDAVWDGIPIDCAGHLQKAHCSQKEVRERPTLCVFVEQGCGGDKAVQHMHARSELVNPRAAASRLSCV